MRSDQFERALQESRIGYTLRHYDNRTAGTDTDGEFVRSERSAKLKEILGTLDVAGTDYLGSIIEAHVDTVDVQELVSQRPEGEVAGANSGSVSRLGIGRKLAQEEVLRQAQALSWKINLLLDARVDPSGQRYKFSVICAGVQKFGIHLSRTRWSRLKEGQAQVVSHDCLRAIANVLVWTPNTFSMRTRSFPRK